MNKSILMRSATLLIQSRPRSLLISFLQYQMSMMLWSQSLFLSHHFLLKMSLNFTQPKCGSSWLSSKQTNLHRSVHPCTKVLSSMHYLPVLALALKTWRPYTHYMSGVFWSTLPLCGTALWHKRTKMTWKECRKLPWKLYWETNISLTKMPWIYSTLKHWITEERNCA